MLRAGAGTDEGRAGQLRYGRKGGVYSACLFCNRHLGRNEVIAAFPIGRRLAFDATRGRLWVVCRRCERWNLSPLEERWEAVEDCERRFRDARKRVSTPNIGLARLDEGLELVRIGEPLRPEFAAWRYGDQFGRRRRRAMLIGVPCTALVLGGAFAASALVGGSWVLYLQLARYVARRIVVARVPAAGGGVLTLRAAHVDQVRLEPRASAEGGWALRLPHAYGEAVLSGSQAVLAATLIMPQINDCGAAQRHVQAAVRRIEECGDPNRFLTAASREGKTTKRFWERELFGPKTAEHTLVNLPSALCLAIEMAANEENERGALEGELELLEMAWREAEEIAAIADSLLLPGVVTERFGQLRRSGRNGGEGSGRR